MSRVQKVMIEFEFDDCEMTGREIDEKLEMFEPVLQDFLEEYFEDVKELKVR